jgi:MFS family permease
MGGFGFIVATLGGAALYEMNPSYPFWMGSMLVILSSLMVFIFTKEPKVYEENEKQPGMIESLKFLAKDRDRSGLRLLLAIFFWFPAYAATRHLLHPVCQKLPGHRRGQQARGCSASSPGLCPVRPAFRLHRRADRPAVTIMLGILVMSIVMLAIFFLSPDILTLPLARLPVLGVVPVLGVLLMVAGAGWALININSLPMVVDMTDAARIGTYTGLYYLFATLSAIIGPNINGWIIQLTGQNYNAIMIVALFSCWSPWC